jgi:hypothetical protein
MTLKDDIPTFPDLLGIYSVVDLVAHGTNNFHDISNKYYSHAERDYAAELAKAKVLGLLKSGLIRATGRRSEIKRGTAARWEAQQYKQHSRIRTYIPVEFWIESAFAKSSLYGTARNRTHEFTDIMVVVDDCREHVGEDIAAHRQGEQAEPATEYSTPYIALMWKAIDEFRISEHNQPIKETLVEWFLKQEIEGQKVSKVTAEYLASFVRLPSSRTGGNRPWKVRAQQHPENA